MVDIAPNAASPTGFDPTFDDTNADGVADRLGEYWFKAVCSGSHVIREVGPVDGNPDVMLSDGQLLDRPLVVEAGTQHVWALGTSSTTSVAGRHIFYNDSFYDGANVALSAADDGAIDTSKSAFLGTGTSDFDNYVNDVDGITGVMVDLLGIVNPSSLSPVSYTHLTLPTKRIV